MFRSGLCVCKCVCLCAKYLKKSYERILMKFSARVGRLPRNDRLDFDGDLDPISLFCLNFPSVMHFRRDNK